MSVIDSNLAKANIAAYRVHMIRPIIWFFFRLPSRLKVAFAMGLLACGAQGQGLLPVDVSAFGRDRLIQAQVTLNSVSECKGATYFQGGASHYDDLSFTVHLTGRVTFINRSNETVLLDKEPDPGLTQRVAASRQDLLSGKFLAGYDGDRMAISQEPKAVSLDNFAVLRPHESYTITFQTAMRTSADPKKPLHTPGTYWVQLGIDARPDEFYFSSAAEKNFTRKWKSKGRLVRFILSEPFAVEIKFEPNVPECTE